MSTVIKNINSIAVLPLDKQSTEADADYISDGISRSVNNSLAKLSVFRVTPSSVTQNYRGKTAEFQRIDKALDVNTGLSGRVVQHGDDLFLSIELNDVHRKTDLASAILAQGQRSS